MEGFELFKTEITDEFALFLEKTWRFTESTVRQNDECASRREKELMEQLAEAQDRARRIDDLLEENKRLRHDLASKASTINCQNAPTEHSQPPKVDDSPNTEAVSDKDAVPYEHYRHLQEKYDSLFKYHSNTKLQGAQYLKRGNFFEEKYKHSKEQLRLYETRLHEYTTQKQQYEKQLEIMTSKNRQDRATVKRWQSWFDRCKHEIKAAKVDTDQLETPAFSAASPVKRSSDRPLQARSPEDLNLLPAQTSVEREPLGALNKSFSVSARSTDQDPGTSDSHSERPSAVAKQDSFYGLPEPFVLKTPAAMVVSNPSSDTVRNGGATGPAVFTPSILRTSSQTTEDDVVGFVASSTVPKPGQARDRSSSPVVISTRVVKRKRDANEAPLPREIAQKIKSEDDGDSPSMFVSPFHLEDNLDLDDLPGDVGTPRKQRLLKRARASQRRGPSQRYGRYNSVPLEAFQDLGANSSDPRLISSFDHSMADDNIKANASHGEMLFEQNAKDRSLSDSFKGRRQTNILQPMDANNQILPRTTSAKARPKQRRRASSEAIEDLAEDGEPVRSRPDHGKDTTAKKKIGPARIKGLLETPSMLNKHTMPPRSARSSRSITNSRFRSSKSVRSRGDQAEEYGIDDVRPDQEPLRARPVTRLCLDDFKVNPRANQGVDYAFVESVRKKDLRQCLPGCTRPECCGDLFRKMAVIGGPINTPTTRRGLWERSSQEDDDEESRLLLPQLGNDPRRLRGLTPDKRAEMLIQVRAQELAQQHGKHRQAFVRAETPPGFWRTGMPSTQEEAQDKEKARRLERQKVQERYDEAMRGGRWMFRDE